MSSKTLIRPIRANDDLLNSMIGEPVEDRSHFEAIPADRRVDLIKPLEFVIEDLIAKGYLYTLTAPNNHGKTTLAALLAASVSKGINFADCRTIAGRVLLLSGENAYDTDLKLKALGDRVNLSEIDVIPSAFEMRTHYQDIIDQNDHRIYSLVLVDSVQAFMMRGDMNANIEAKEHILSFRHLTRLKGNPAVIALAHPTKAADPNNLVPYGGGSIMNEIDTNLTLYLNGEIATLHHTKARQPSFAPKKFRLKVTEFGDMLNNFGKPVTSTHFEAMSSGEAYKEEVKSQDAEIKVFQALYRTPELSTSKLAYEVFGCSDNAAASRLRRSISDMRKNGYLEPSGKYLLTEKGVRRARTLLKQKTGDMDDDSPF